MIPNKFRPILSGWRTILILIYLKTRHHATGLKYYFGDFGVIRIDAGSLQLGGGNWIEKLALIHCAGGNISIGERTFINRGSLIVSKESVTIGNDVLIGDYVSIYDHDHKLSKHETQGYTSKPVNISDNVWIGSHAVILKGISIGKNSIVAAGSIVTKDIPEHQLWGGVPATFMKEL